MATGAGALPEDRDISPLQPDRSLGELFGQLTSDLGRLMRQEVALAKVETKEEVGRTAKASSFLVVGGLMAYLALILLAFALAWLLDQWMNRALAFLIVGVLGAVVAAVLVSMGRARLRQVNLVPEQTVETIKEDVQWARAQRS